MNRNLLLALRTIAAWVVTLLIVFPLIWLVLTAFKTEQQAIAAPAAYSMAFFRTRKTRDILMWMLSTKMMPAVGALVPIYVMAQTAGLLDSRTALIVVFTLSNLPIMVWMLYSGFKDIPPDILEAARMDGANAFQKFWFLTLPHLGRPIAVVVMIEMIFLMSVFAEIFTTTGGGPGNESTNVAFLIFKQALMNFDVGVASAGALFAVVLANIAAVFLIRMIGKNLD
jgi:ABC-type glycerol-3-phosphate transport system permease component